jgi:hypothetical protein
MKQNATNARIVSRMVNKYLSRVKENNPSYSNRALARDVGLSPAFISDILKGKKPLPFKHVENFIRVLDMDQADAGVIKKSYVPDGVGVGGSSATPAQSEAWKLGTKEQMKILSQWYYLPMIDLCTCIEFDGDFSKSLGITKQQEVEALDFLLDLGVIFKTEVGYQKTNRKLHFTSAKSQADFRKYHAEMLMKSLDELKISEEERFKQRLIIGFTLALNSKKLAEFKKQLSDLIYQAINEMSDEDCDQVYHLGMQFYPLSQVTPKNKK